MENDIVNKIIEELESGVYCRLRPSTISGVGVFAIRDIPKGTDPFKTITRHNFIEVDPKLIFENQKIDPAVKELVSDMWVIADGKLNLWDAGLNALDMSFYLNHSTQDGNIVAEEEGAVFVAVRDIKKGEELLVNYETYAENPNIPDPLAS